MSVANRSSHSSNVVSATYVGFVLETSVPSTLRTVRPTTALARMDGNKPNAEATVKRVRKQRRTILLPSSKGVFKATEPQAECLAAWTSSPHRSYRWKESMTLRLDLSKHSLAKCLSVKRRDLVRRHSALPIPSRILFENCRRRELSHAEQ